VIFVIVGERQAPRSGLGGNLVCSTIDELTLRLGKSTRKREEPAEVDGMDNCSSIYYKILHIKLKLILSIRELMSRRELWLG